MVVNKYKHGLIYVYINKTDKAGRVREENRNIYTHFLKIIYNMLVWLNYKRITEAFESDSIMITLLRQAELLASRPRREGKC